MPNLQGPEYDSRPGELRSIASSIEPAFPDAASRLRAIAENVMGAVDKKPTPWGFTFLGTVLVLAFITFVVMALVKLGTVWF